MNLLRKEVCSKYKVKNLGMFHESVKHFLCKIWTKNGVVLGMKLYVGEEVGDNTPPFPKQLHLSSLPNLKNNLKNLDSTNRSLLIHLKGEDPPYCHLLL